LIQEASSKLDEFAPGTHFQPVIADTHIREAKRVVLVAGKIYYDLVRERAERKLESDIAFVRIEELCPFPFVELARIVGNGGKQWLWAQEEPRNQGAWTHVSPRLAALGINARYVGRREDAVPAVGDSALHRRRWASVLDGVFSGL